MYVYFTISIQCILVNHPLLYPPSFNLPQIPSTNIIMYNYSDKPILF